MNASYFQLIYLIQNLFLSKRFSFSVMSCLRLERFHFFSWKQFSKKCCIWNSDVLYCLMSMCQLVKIFLYFLYSTNIVRWTMRWGNKYEYISIFWQLWFTVNHHCRQRLFDSTVLTLKWICGVRADPGQLQTTVAP